MKMVTTIGEMASKLITKRTALLFFLLMTVVCGCAVLSNSARFYQDRRPGPINWRQYTSD